MTTERGKVAVGGNCNNGENGGECAASPEGQVGCVYGSPGGGVCSVQLLGAEGASGCVADSQLDGSIASGASISVPTPPKGYYCDRTKSLHCDTATTLCMKPSAVGGPCAYNDYECDPAAYCDTTAKKCKTRIAIDGACAFREKCTTGAYCGATSRCTASLANGEACKGDTQCVSQFCKAGTCAAGFSGSGAAGICKN